MLTRNKISSILALGLMTGVAATVPAFMPRFGAQELPAAPGAALQASWDAVALGRVEPKSREVRMTAPIPGRVADVLVKANDEVFGGELLVRLDDEEAVARVAAADALVALRRRARNDQSTPTGAAGERRKAEDAAADLARAIAEARSSLDRAAADWRAGGVPRADVEAARTSLARAETQWREQQAALVKLRASSDTPLPTRLEGELNVARAEWTLAQAILDKTRIRAPFDGTVLQIDAKKGEMAMPSLEPALLVLGDVSGLRVRAEVDEQYLGRIRVGQRILVRTSAFRGHSFDGKVASIARIVGPSRINSRVPRKFSDVDVLEVVIDLTSPGPLVVGEQVDVYFSSERTEQAETQTQ